MKPVSTIIYESILAHPHPHHLKKPEDKNIEEITATAVIDARLKLGRANSFVEAFITCARIVFLKLEVVMKKIWNESPTWKYNDIAMIADKLSLSREVFIIITMISPSTFMIKYPEDNLEKTKTGADALVDTTVTATGPFKGKIHSREIDTVTRIMQFHANLEKIRQINFKEENSIEDNYSLLARFYSSRFSPKTSIFKKIFLHLKYWSTPELVNCLYLDQK